VPALLGMALMQLEVAGLVDPARPPVAGPGRGPAG
jgi:hypothetical protein